MELHLFKGVSHFWGSLTLSNHWVSKTVPVAKNAFLANLITWVPSPGPTVIGESWFLGVAPDLHTSECVIIVIISKIIIKKRWWLLWKYRRESWGLCPRRQKLFLSLSANTKHSAHSWELEMGRICSQFMLWLWSPFQSSMASHCSLNQSQLEITDWIERNKLDLNSHV